MGQYGFFYQPGGRLCLYGIRRRVLRALVVDVVTLAVPLQLQARLIVCPFLYCFRGHGIDVNQRKRVFNATRVAAVALPACGGRPKTTGGLRI